MNTKAIAALVVVAVMMAGAGVYLAADDSQAAGVGTSDDPIVLTTMVVSGSGSDTTRIVVNEAEFKGYNYTLTWGVNTESTTWVSLGSITSSGPDSGAGFTPGSGVAYQTNYTVSMAGGNTTGEYVLTVAGNGSQSNLSDPIKIRCTIEVTVGLNSEVETMTLYYNQPVTTTAPSTNLSFNSARFTVGSYYGSSISTLLTTSGINVADYTWYAIGLPAGVSMSSSGYISGIPTTSAVANGSATIIATSSEGTVSTGSLSWTVSASSVSPSDDYCYSVTVGSDPVIENPTTSVNAQKGQSVTLNVYRGSTIGSNAADAHSVTVVGSSGSITLSNDDDGSYVLPTDGTGAYLVQIEFTDGGDTAQFYLFVTASLGNIEASIVPVGN